MLAIEFLLCAVTGLGEPRVFMRIYEE
jgi:hypothetical protein